MKQNQQKQALRLYLKELSKIPLLTAAEEKELAARAQAGDQAAVQKMVESNLRFVVKIAKKYRNLGVSFLDLIGEGNLGLIQAAQRFDPARNVKFISYAVWWIRQSIVSALANQRHPLRLPLKINNTLYKAGLATNRKADELDRKPSHKEVADELGMNQDDLIAILNVGGGGISLDEPLNQQSEQVLEDMLVQTSIPSVENNMIEESVNTELKKALSKLGKNEEQVLRLRFGLDDDTPRTLSYIGNKIGLSRERVRQIQVRGLQKLKMDPRSALRSKVS
jgi:RNA polymerase primary sigma factor